MFSIGQFSVLTRLSIKALRIYHELGILVPDYIDEITSYRYYNETSIEKARVIAQLKSMEFTLSTISSILNDYTDDMDILDFLEKQRMVIEVKHKKYKAIQNDIENIIKQTRRNQMKIESNNYEITEKQLEELLFAGFRMKGKYHEIGKAFQKVGRKAGRYIQGKPIGLYYDGEYKEENADFEGGFLVRKKIEVKEINCRVLQSAKAVSLIHKGSYDTIGNSYEKIFKYIEQNKYETQLPSREVYLKGPGMIFKGNPEKYLTEIQILIE